jgi:hypothetical protein
MEMGGVGHDGLSLKHKVSNPAQLQATDRLILCDGLRPGGGKPIDPILTHNHRCSQGCKLPTVDPQPF